MTEWTLNQQNRISFVMVNAAGAEVPGLGAGFVLQLSKSGAAFQASAGVNAEIGNGWYTYLSTAGEADTIGPVAIRVNGAGCVQQNLEYVVKSRIVGAVEFTYTVTDAGTGLPIEGVEVWFTTDAGGTNTVWYGVTDVFGVARDNNDELPMLDAGTYYIWKQRSGYIDDDNPDVEVVS